ncbi:MAG: OmpA family protein, partial [Bacteroidota bacterium]
TLLFLLFGIISFLGYSQIKFPEIGKEDAYNFVPNPSFEVTMDIPCAWNQGIGKFEKWFIDWNTPTETTPDLISAAAQFDCWSHPNKNNGGKQFPRTGHNMIGMKMYGKGGTDTYWHEYVQIKLKEPLKKDTVYYAEFWVNLSAKASKAVNNFGMALSHEETDTRNRLPLYITPVVNEDKIVKPRLFGWKKIKGVFKAKGGEEFLMLGNFYGDEVTQKERIPGKRDGGYYYFDDVMIRRAKFGERPGDIPKESLPPPPKEEIKEDERVTTEEIELTESVFEVGAVIELENIFFEFDKAELLEESKNELMELRDLLFDYPFMEIEVSGHTDNVGKDEYNQKLSEQRAKAVVEFLDKEDIDIKRLTYKGYGASRPISSNESEEGQAQNRRVEFTILKN